MEIQPQWSLDQSSGSLFNLFRGVLQAATSDNVQPLAIMACEQFGNTIAMCPETCSLIEKVVVPSPKPATIQFLKGVVGFSSNDSATQLSKSLAGVQFLGLATALLASMTTWPASLALEMMLRQSTTDKTLLPTRTQIRDLLARLEPRCHAASFADSVAGWNLLLRDHVKFHGPITAQVPAPSSIEKIVDALRQLFRVGEETAIHISIKSSDATGWIIAFIKWCIGASPSVCFSDGTHIIENPSSRITVIAFDGSVSLVMPLEIQIRHRVRSLEEIVVPHAGHPWTGMVSPRVYGRLLLEDKGIISGQSLRAVKQAIPYMVSSALTHVLYTKSSNRPSAESFIQDWERFGSLRLSPLPNISVIIRAISLILDVEDIESLPTLENGQHIYNLPIVHDYLKTIIQKCHCAICSPDISFKFQTCLMAEFSEKLANITANILGLSLIKDSENVLLEVPPCLSHSQHTELLKSIWNDGNTCNVRTLSVMSLFTWTLGMLGHEVDDVEQSELLMSSAKGQVIYPVLIDAQSIRGNGYLTLACNRGVLLHKGQVYSRVIDRPFSRFVEIEALVKHPRLTQTKNPPARSKPTWLVNPSDGFIEARLIFEPVPPGRRNEVMFSNIWEVLARSIVLENCSHDDYEIPESADKYNRYITAGQCEFDESVNGMRVVALNIVDGAEDLRIFALAGLKVLGIGEVPFSWRPWLVVIRKKACFGCCLEVCRQVDAQYLVL